MTFDSNVQLELVSVGGIRLILKITTKEFIYFNLSLYFSSSSTINVCMACVTTSCAPTSPPSTRRPSSATLSPRWTARTRTSTGTATTTCTRPPRLVRCRPLQPRPQPQLLRLPITNIVQGVVGQGVPSVGVDPKWSTTMMSTRTIILRRGAQTKAQAKTTSPETDPIRR